MSLFQTLEKVHRNSHRHERVIAEPFQACQLEEYQQRKISDQMHQWARDRDGSVWMTKTGSTGGSQGIYSITEVVWYLYSFRYDAEPANIKSIFHHLMACGPVEKLGYGKCSGKNTAITLLVEYEKSVPLRGFQMLVGFTASGLPMNVKTLIYKSPLALVKYNEKALSGPVVDALSLAPYLTSQQYKAQIASKTAYRDQARKSLQTIAEKLLQKYPGLKGIKGKLTEDELVQRQTKEKIYIQGDYEKFSQGVEPEYNEYDKAAMRQMVQQPQMKQISKEPQQPEYQPTHQQENQPQSRVNSGSEPDAAEETVQRPGVRLSSTVNARQQYPLVPSFEAALNQSLAIIQLKNRLSVVEARLDSVDIIKMLAEMREQMRHMGPYKKIKTDTVGQESNDMSQEENSVYGSRRRVHRPVVIDIENQPTPPGDDTFRGVSETPTGPNVKQENIEKRQRSIAEEKPQFQGKYTEEKPQFRGECTEEKSDAAGDGGDVSGDVTGSAAGGKRNTGRKPRSVGKPKAKGNDTAPIRTAITPERLKQLHEQALLKNQGKK